MSPKMSPKMSLKISDKPETLEQSELKDNK